jgi:diguanylate cyclase (GGDEF)-like protein/PAS domain S-box-containing protein
LSWLSAFMSDQLTTSRGRGHQPEPAHRALAPLAGLACAHMLSLWIWSGLALSSLWVLTVAGGATVCWLLRRSFKAPGDDQRTAAIIAMALLANSLLALYFNGAVFHSSIALGVSCVVAAILLSSFSWMAAVGGLSLAAWLLVVFANRGAYDSVAAWLCPGLVGVSAMVFLSRMAAERVAGQLVRKLTKRVRQLEAQLESEVQVRVQKSQEATRVLEKRGETEGLWDWDLNSDRMTFSPRWARMLGYSAAEIGESPESWFNLIHPHDLGRTLDRMTAHLEGREPNFECEHRIQVRDGGYCWVLSRGQALLGEGGKPERVLGSQIHLGRLKSFESKLLHDATHDKLTGLPNRHYLLARLREDFSRAGRNDRYGFAVVFLDLDGFKGVNDSLGHLAGDRLLSMVGKRLAETKRTEDTVARLGGDEFVMILRNLRDEGEALTLAAKTQEALSAPFRLADQDLVTGSSIGVAMYASEITRTEDLLRNADIAMYHAKSSRKGAIQVFDAEMHVRTRRLWNLQTDLRGAIDRGELRLLYQPFIEVESGRICGAEALIRWRRSDGEMVSPAEFIPLAEEQGLIGAIGEWALHTACLQNKEWQAAGLRPVKISVNLSTKQLSNHEFAATVRRVIEETQLEPKWLQLELTETALMGSLDATPASLYSLFCMDIQLAIDDFGTGYSSLGYLRKLQFDTLKIDKSFVEDIATDRRAAALARSIISMAHSLRMSSLAEGVETLEQLELLRAYGCNVVQGYLASRPIPPQEFATLLQGDVRLLERAAAARSGLVLDKTGQRASPVNKNLTQRFSALASNPIASGSGGSRRAPDRAPRPTGMAAVRGIAPAPRL